MVYDMLSTLFMFPGTYVLAQFYNAKDRLYEKQKCKKLETNHYHERKEGGALSEKNPKN